MRSPVFAAVSLVLVILVAVGCSRSSTERAREAAPPEALEALLDAQGFLESGLYTYALGTLDQSESLAPDLADFPFLRGRVLAGMRQYDGAMVAYGRTLELDPGYPGVHLNMGNVEYQRGETAKALAHYRMERSEAAESPAFLIQFGRALADAGSVDSSRAAYEAAIAADPTDATPHMWLGQLLEDQGALDEALEHSLKGLEMEPDNLNYVYVAGVQMLRVERLDEAAEYLQRAADGMPGHYAAHYNLGQALNGLGRTNEGAAYLARADELLELRREVDEWEALVASNSQEPMLWVNYGNSLMASDRLDEAINAFSVAYSLNPQWLELQNNIANLLLMRGDTLAAVERYEGLLTVDSTLTDIWLNLGTVHALQGRYGEARTAWESALRHDPQNAEVREYMSKLPVDGIEE